MEIISFSLNLSWNENKNKNNCFHKKAQLKQDYFLGVDIIALLLCM